MFAQIFIYAELGIFISALFCQSRMILIDEASLILWNSDFSAHFLSIAVLK